VQQIQRDGFGKGLLGKAKLSRGGGKGRGQGFDVNTLLDRFVDALSVFYVVEPGHHPRAHDAPPSSPAFSGSAFPSTPSNSNQRHRRPQALSRLGWLALTFLFLLGLREIIVLSRPGRHDIKISGRNPFDVLADYARAEKPRSSGAMTGQDRLWKTRVRTSSEDKYLDETREGDVTGIVLHWKRTENVVVIVASLCQYSFFDSILVWNNNPDIHLTREVSVIPCRCRR
jgi:hypothetical protein